MNSRFASTRLKSDQLKDIQQNPSLVRNVCILAHVDHGKTTLADSLIASNGIISERLAGELRYMDSREDEQERGITMKSSAVTLQYCRKKRNDTKQHLINLIDSPGHVDFSTEVSTAVRLCDGAFIVVDVVEGAAPQTYAVLRQAWVERIKPVLVVNKIDRLFTELKLSPAAAYSQIRKVVEEVNAIIGQLFHSDMFLNLPTSTEEISDSTKQEGHLTSDRFKSWAVDFDSIDDTGVFFQPELGNVVFASAIDKWAFSLKDFSEIYAPRLNVLEKDLLAALWGDFYFEASTKTFKLGAADKGKTPVFVKIVMENLSIVYDTIESNNTEKLLRICSQLKLQINERRLIKADGRSKLQSVLGSWLPLADGLLEATILYLPSPANLTEDRIERLLSGQLAVPFNSLPNKTKELKQTFQTCGSSEADSTIIFVSKLFPVPASVVSDVKHRTIQDHEEQVFLAFARIFSGTVRRKQKLYLIEAKYIPGDSEGTADNLPDHVVEVEIGELFFLMGREVEKIDEVRAGNVFGISGLDKFIFKSGTLSSTLACPPFLPIAAHAIPVVQVAIEPAHPNDDEALRDGLQLLSRSDPCVEVSISSSSGEFLVRTAGEVHLHRCITDLQERFAGIELRVSQPTVPFRETVSTTPAAMSKLSSSSQSEDVVEPGIVRLSTVGNHLTVTIRATSVPPALVTLLSNNSTFIKNIHRAVKTKERLQKNSLSIDSEKLTHFKEKCFELAGSGFATEIKNVLSFGPGHCGTNILTLGDDTCPLALKMLWTAVNEELSSTSEQSGLFSIFNSIVNGFQLASSSGPLCEEPLSGVCFSIVNITLDETALESISLGSLNGQTVSLIKDCCRKAFSSLPQRLLVAMYTCTVQITPEMLGRLHGVISRRFGRVTSEDANDTCSHFITTAVIPVIESFGLAEELRKRTSGLVIDPQLKFSNWEMLDADPTSFVVVEDDDKEEEDSLEESMHNQAKRYMLAVRRRKGLSTGEQLVSFAEKQRTLSKKK